VRIAETVAAELRARILAGDEGMALPKQDELVAEFGVSSPSVREALRILETERLISVRRGNVGGAEIRRPDAGSAAYSLGLALQSARVRQEDLASALLRFEPMCAAMCAERRDRKAVVVAPLNENIARTRELIEDGVEFTHTAREFHDIIVATTGNMTITLVVRSLVALWSVQEESWAESLTTRGEYFSEAERRSVVNVHTRIASKIEDGDAQGAERTAAAHLEMTQRLFLSRFHDELVDAASARARRSFQSLA
jgi:GntR family transcriptional regulator, transcriptional repressor for pyruvate dehydrogenase complex